MLARRILIFDAVIMHVAGPQLFARDSCADRGRARPSFICQSARVWKKLDASSRDFTARRTLIFRCFSGILTGLRLFSFGLLRCIVVSLVYIIKVTMINVNALCFCCR